MDALSTRMKLFLTIDVEAHRVIDEIAGSRADSLGTILRLLNEEGAAATFFVDVCEVHKWGREFIRTTCDRIQAAGHDIQLHVHPHHATGDSRRWLLSEYSSNEQEKILDDSVVEFQVLTGKYPSAFRAGGFGADESTLRILAQRGIACDSSFLWRRPGCNLTPPYICAPSHYCGLLEVPLNAAIVLGTRKRPLRVSCLDFNWLPIWAIETLLLAMHRAGHKSAVVLLHSSSMYVRIGRTRLWYRRANEKRLRRLIRFAIKQGYACVPMSGNGAAQPKDAPVVVLQNPVSQYAVLFYQALIGFGISRKFRWFVIGNIAILIGFGFLLGNCGR
jgi:peptidoglycan/xylan/chitin deacetylase (PgdA/CDA1 family)